MEKLTVVELKDELRLLGLSTGGLKAQLIFRLIEALQKEGKSVDRFLRQRILRKENEQTQEQPFNQGNFHPIPPSSVIVNPEDSVSQTSRRSSRSNRSVRSSLAHERAEIAALMVKQARLNEKKAIEQQKKAIEQQKLEIEQQKIEIDLKNEEHELQTQIEIARARETVFKESDSAVSGEVQRLAYKFPVDKAEKVEISNTLPPQSVKFKNDSSSRNSNLADTNTPNKSFDAKETRTSVQSDMMQTLVTYNLKSLMPKTEIFKFDGDFTRYQIFIRAFETLISDKLTDEEEKLYYLEQYTSGSPREIVRACLHMDPSEGYKEARRLLERRYGDSERIATAYVNQVLDWKNIKADDVTGLDEFSIMLTNCKNAVTRVKFGLNELENPKTMRRILEKLPYYMQERWRRHVYKITETESRSVNFNDIVVFIDEEARVQSNPLFGRQLFLKSRDPKEDPLKRKERVNATIEKRDLECWHCKGNHILDNCDVLKQFSYKDRIEELSKLKVCFSCLRKNHISKNCKSVKKCEHCSGKHPTLLHRQADEPFDNACNNSPEDSFNPQNGISEGQSTSVLRVNTRNSLSGDLYRMSVIPVKIKTNNGISIVT